MRNQGVIQGLEKGIKILYRLAQEESPLDVLTIARDLDLPKSTAYRYISTLKRWGLIEEDPKRGYYRLGKGILELSQSLRSRIDYIDIAFPIMEKLHRETGESIVLAALHGHKAIWIEKIDSHHKLRISCDPGTTQYLHAGASAKAIFAYLPPERQEEVIKKVGLPQLTERTITDWATLKNELESIRSTGVAISHGEVDPGVIAVAAPIFNHRGQIWGSISVVGPEQRFSPGIQALIIQKVKVGAEEINSQIAKYGI